MTGAFCAAAAHVETCTQWPVGSRWKAPSNGIEMSNNRHTSIAVMTGRLRTALFIRSQCTLGGPSRLPIEILCVEILRPDDFLAGQRHGAVSSVRPALDPAIVPRGLELGQQLGGPLRLGMPGASSPRAMQAKQPLSRVPRIVQRVP
jgi:hypothetical protein